MSVGERTPLALLDAAAAARMAVGEAITNLCAAPVEALDRIKLSANWMAAAGHPGEDAKLFDAVRAVGLELAPQLDLSIPVGKDSLSMQAQWNADGVAHKSVSPVSLIVSAFAPVDDVRKQLTPLLARETDSEIWLIGLGGGKQRLGGSVLAQCHPESGAGSQALPAFAGPVPDLDDPQRLRAFFELIRDARNVGILQAYHDRSDGGAFAALCEMAFASHLGLDISLDGWGEDPFRTLFNEELGALVQVGAEGPRRIRRPRRAPRPDRLRAAHRAADRRRRSCASCATAACSTEWRWEALFDAWWSVTHAMQRLRDNPECADEEARPRARFDAPGLQPKLTFDPAEDIAAPYIAPARARAWRSCASRASTARSKRRTASTGRLRRGRRAHERPHRRSRAAGRLQRFRRLRRFQLRRRARRGPRLGDLGARTPGDARGLRALLRTRRHLCPGRVQRLPDARAAQADHPGRRALAALPAQPQRAVRSAPGVAGSVRVAVDLPARHGRFAHPGGGGAWRRPRVVRQRHGRREGACRVALRRRRRPPAGIYPANPNGSPDAIAGLTTTDGRVTILMPHPERTLRSANYSWAPRDWADDSPWMRIFRNARKAIG
jgi:phosphoribosylformylglycinamidine synthase